MHDKAAAIIRKWESCRLDAYQDVAGIWTIGFGSTLGVKAGDRITQDQADALLLAEIERKAMGIRDIIKVPLSDNEMAALISLAFNIGLGALKGSTAAQDINSGDKLGGCAAFALWNRAGGKRVKGLLRRRVDEMALFLSGD